MMEANRLRKPPQNNPWTKDLQSLGAHVRIEAADVTRREDIVRLRQDMAKDMPPVAGIMNGAMLLADGLFADMTFDNMHRVLQPKVDGSRNLDTIFSDVNLDFFVMLSSVNAVTGMMGQANYSAANMVCCFRLLPCSFMFSLTLLVHGWSCG